MSTATKTKATKATKGGTKTKAKKTPKANPDNATVAKPAAKEGKLSAINAAHQVLLAKKGEPMSCPEMITEMEGQGLWKSPGGKTPAATLYSAILREIGTKGASSRFVKADRGKFAAKV